MLACDGTDDVCSGGRPNGSDAVAGGAGARRAEAHWALRDPSGGDGGESEERARRERGESEERVSR